MHRARIERLLSFRGPGATWRDMQISIPATKVAVIVFYNKDSGSILNIHNDNGITMGDVADQLCQATTGPELEMERWLYLNKVATGSLGHFFVMPH
jgi:hypothetical protein